MIIGYTTGVFDMFHIGHLNCIRHAKEQCDFLVVGVSTDELVKEYKRKKPVIPFEQRLEIVRAIRYVDSAVRQDSRDKFAAYKELGFQRLFVGSDWKGTEFWNAVEKQFELFGVEVVYLPYTEGISSTELRESIKKEAMLPPNLIMGGGNIGYTTGVFDLFHVGHLNILCRAKEQCDFLVVGVSTDELVKEYKRRMPVIPFDERSQIISSLRCVDAVVAQTSLDKRSAWEKLHFDTLFHGSDWKGSEMYKNIEMEMENIGVAVSWIPYTEEISSTMLRKINGFDKPMTNI